MDSRLFMRPFGDFVYARITRRAQWMGNSFAPVDGFMSEFPTRRAYANILILTDADITKSSNQFIVLSLS